MTPTSSDNAKLYVIVQLSAIWNSFFALSHILLKCQNIFPNVKFLHTDDMDVA